MFKRILTGIHKIAGLLLSILFLMWFLSGIVMIYYSFPRVSVADKLQKQQTIDITNLPSIDTLVSILPDSVKLQSISLDMYFDRPVFHYKNKGQTSDLYADSLQPIEEVTFAVIEKTATQWCSSPVLRVDSLRKLDQWIPFGYLKKEFPIYKFTYADAARHELYISSKTGKVLQFTDKNQRFWAWLGAIPHWVYFTSLRQNQPLWINVVKWTSGIGTVMCLAGLWLGIRILWNRRRYGFSSPYKKRWLHWHYISGLIFGVCTATFVFSGMMSLMDLPDWLKKTPKEKRESSWRNKSKNETLPLNAYLLDYRQVVAAFDSVKSIEWSSYQKRPYYKVIAGSRTVNIDASESTDIQMFVWTEDMIREEIKQIHGDSISYRLAFLTEYDEDYYTKNKESLLLPVYRVIVNDKMHTRHYFEPHMLVHRQIDDDRRLSRLLYSGFHSLNFKFLTDRPVLWNTVMYILMLGGTFLSFTGVVLTVKWAIRKIKKITK